MLQEDTPVADQSSPRLVEDEVMTMEPQSRLKRPIFGNLTFRFGMAELRGLHDSFLGLSDYNQADGFVDFATFKAHFEKMPRQSSGAPAAKYVEEVRKLFSNDETERINVNAYFGFMGIAVMGTDRRKLETVFGLFDTHRDGWLRGGELSAISRCVASLTGTPAGFGNVNPEHEKAARRMLGAGPVAVGEFVSFCLEQSQHVQVAMLVQKAFLEVLTEPPRHDTTVKAVVSQYAQQATLARRRVDQLKKAQEKEQALARQLAREEEAMAQRRSELDQARKDLELERSYSAAEESFQIAADRERAAEDQAALDEQTAEIEAKRRELDAKAAEAARAAAVEEARLQELERKRKAEEQRLAQQRAVQNAEIVRKREAEAKAKAAEAERLRREHEERLRVEQARQDAQLEAQKKAALESEQRRWMERDVQAAGNNAALVDWHAGGAAAPGTEAYRRQKIEEAERAAILESGAGSTVDNDAAILAAMAATKQFGTLARAPKARSTPPPPPAPAAPAGEARKVAADADYLLSMILSNVTEDTESRDEAGRRYHIDGKGARLYRELDVQQNPFSGTPVVGNTLSRRDTTLNRRERAKRAVEERQAAAKAREQEASMRSLARKNEGSQLARAEIDRQSSMGGPGAAEKARVAQLMKMREQLRARQGGQPSETGF